MTSEAEIERTFALFEQAAADGKPAPANDRNGGPANLNAVLELYRRRRIKGFIYRRNYRVVVILTGPHAGKSTALPPGPPCNPWRIIDHTGTTYVKKAELERL